MRPVRAGASFAIVNRLLSIDVGDGCWLVNFAVEGKKEEIVKFYPVKVLEILAIG